MSNTWYKLDNSAKIMPSMTNSLNTNVFRLICTLKEEISSEILTQALNETLEEFPIFMCSMKMGLFWHYLEPSNKEILVEEECTNPCSKIQGIHLFRLSYYKNLAFTRNSTYIYLHELLEFLPLILYYTKVVTFKPLAIISAVLVLLIYQF